MKRLTCLFLTLFFFTAFANAQLFEDFEQGTLTSYPAEPQEVTLSSGVWIFHQTVLGRDARDRKNGEQAPRLRASGGVNGSLAMGFDKENGAGLVSFVFANSGFFGDTGGRLQLQYSLDSGTSWTTIGDELIATDELQLAQISVNRAGNIRFRILHTAGNRINIDDFQATDFSEEPTIALSRGAQTLTNGSSLNLGITSLGNQRLVDVTIRNLGNQSLSLSNVTVSGAGFTLHSAAPGEVQAGATANITLGFTPTGEGEATGSLSISSNATNHPEFNLTLNAEGFSRDVISINEARALGAGNRVSVGGWITALDEFRGPVFFEDYTAGLAWFDPELMPATGDFGFSAAHGDSIVISGTLIEVNAITGQPGSGLMKISQDNYEVLLYPEANRTIEPTVISARQLTTGAFSGRFVRINAASFTQSGTFTSGDLLTITDRTSNAGRFRVNASTNISGTNIPSGRTGIIGIVFSNQGNHELHARGTFDLDPNAYVFAGDDIPQDHTLDVVTWNIEWFGSSSSGPGNVELQVQNVKQVIETLNADLYAFQEIANIPVFNNLVAQLPGYSGLVAPFTQTQRTAYLFRNSTIEVLNSGLLTTGQNSSDWAGRLPFWLRFNANISGHVIEIDSYNVHAKAFSDLDSYNQRVRSSNSLKAFLDANRIDQNVIFLGDYNDFVVGSTPGGGLPSPYQNFQDDPHYYILTTPLQLAGFASWRFSSMIDHITVTNDLIENHIEGAQRVDDTSTYIANYLNTTSDHFPVLTRFYFGTTTSIEQSEEEIPQLVSLSQNYPNPFNPTTNIQFQLSNHEQVSLTVYDITGRRVATLVNGELRSPGTHTVSFNASNLASGMYLYRLSLSNGKSLTNKMMLIK